MSGKPHGYEFLAQEQLCTKISRSEKLSQRFIWTTTMYSCKISIDSWAVSVGRKVNAKTIRHSEWLQGNRGGIGFASRYCQSYFQVYNLVPSSLKEITKESKSKGRQARCEWWGEGEKPKGTKKGLRWRLACHLTQVPPNYLGLSVDHLAFSGWAPLPVQLHP